MTETIHQLGRSGPTSFVLRYETENVPDRIEVFYQRARVLDTGGTDTVWGYTVSCPA